MSAINKSPRGGRGLEGRKMRVALLPAYTTDRARRNIVRCGARALGVPLPALRRMTRRELSALLRRARRRAEREWHRASLRIDALVALEELLREVAT